MKEAHMPIAAIYGPDDFGTPARKLVPEHRGVSRAEPATSLPMPTLEWTPEVERATAHLYARVQHVIPSVEWPFFAPYVKAINDLKTQLENARADLGEAFEELKKVEILEERDQQRERAEHAAREQAELDRIAAQRVRV